MSRILMRLVLTVMMTGAMFQTVDAGPVSRGLEERGDDVGFPKPRPPQQDFFLQQSEQLKNPSKPGDATQSSNGDDPDLPRVGSRDTKSEPSAPLSVENNVKPEKKPEAKPETKSVATKTKAVIPQTVEDDADGAEGTPAEDPVAVACMRELAKFAEFRPTSSPASKDKACTIPYPVELIATRSKFPLRFTKGLTLDCPFALKLAKFADGTVQALARHHRNTPIVRILSGEGFVCRRRNNARAGKLSEHAFGNATDWVGFHFEDGSRLNIRDTSGMKPQDAAFLQNVRSTSCGSFTTVLGPGANAAHATHFHFDLGRSKGKKNPYKICE